MVTLKEWLDARPEITKEAFGASLRHPVSGPTIYRLVNRTTTRVTLEMAIDIEDATNGEVPARQWLTDGGD